MTLLSQHYEEDILRPFSHVLTLFCFSFSGQFHELTNSMASSSSLFLVMAYFVMKDFDEVALHKETHKPLFWFYYVVFLDHLNIVGQNISSPWS
jgi:uncharacterized membrane protein